MVKYRIVETEKDVYYIQEKKFLFGSYRTLPQTVTYTWTNATRLLEDYRNPYPRHYYCDEEIW